MQKNTQTRLARLFEEIGLDARFPADSIVERVESIFDDAIVEALEEMDFPEPRDIVKSEDLAQAVNEAGFVDEDKFGELLGSFDVPDQDDLDKYVKNDELEDALESLDVVTTDALVPLAKKADLDDYVTKSQVRDEVTLFRELNRGGFVRRLKWLLTGR